MSIEKITSKIISDAEGEAKAVLDEAKTTCDGIIAEATEKADKIVSQAQERGQEERDKLVSRRKAVADIDGRKIVLENKQALIRDCFDKAVDKIISDKDKYIDFMAKIVASTGYTEGELIFNAEESKSVGPAVVEKIGKEIPGSKITLSTETKEIKGGFLLKNGSVYVNGTIEALVEDAKEELVAEVANILFQ